MHDVRRPLPQWVRTLELHDTDRFLPRAKLWVSGSRGRLGARGSGVRLGQNDACGCADTRQTIRRVGMGVWSW